MMKMIKKAAYSGRFGRSIILVFVTSILFGNCSRSNVSSECIEGEVIGFIECLNIQVVLVKSSDLKGQPLQWGNKKYSNVVQSPGGKIDSGKIFFAYRDVRPEDDFPKNQICPANVAPISVPKIKILKFSSSGCP